MVLRRVWDELDAAAHSEQCVQWMRKAMARNPFTLPLIDGVIAAAPDPMTAIEMLDVFTAMFEPYDADEYELYRQTVGNLVYERILALPSPATKEGKAQLLNALERQECAHANVLARTWKQQGGDSFEENTLASCLEYLDSPDRMKNKKASRRFAETIRDWGRALNSKKRRTAWAEALLEPFKGDALLVIRRKTSIDPVYERLCGFAERPVPTIEELNAE